MERSDIMTKKLTARCGSCGTNWSVFVETESTQNHLSCPYCHNSVILDGVKLNPICGLVNVPDEESRRWL